MMRCNIVILVTMTICIATIHADTDCSKGSDIKNMENCCNMPKLNFDVYKRQCGKFLSTTVYPTKCLMECVFKAYRVLNNVGIDVATARVMLITILGPNEDFIDTYIHGLTNCTYYVQQKVKLVARRQSNVRASESICSPLAIMYSVCATKYVYFHCPSTSWSNTSACNAASDFMNTCKPDWRRDIRNSSALKD